MVDLWTSISYASSSFFCSSSSSSTSPSSILTPCNCKLDPVYSAQYHTRGLVYFSVVITRQTSVLFHCNCNKLVHFCNELVYFFVVIATVLVHFFIAITI